MRVGVDDTIAVSPEDPIVRFGRILPQMIVLVWLPTCFVIGLVNRNLLPPKYFFDDAHIQNVMLSATGPSSDSFITMAWLYRSVGALGHPTIVQAVTMIAFFVLLLACAPWSSIADFGPIETAMFCFAALASAIYLAQYTKESLVLLVVAVLVMARTVAGEIVFVALACVYAAYIRPYWFMIVALYIVLRVVGRHSRRPALLLGAVIGSLLAFAIGAETVLGAELGSFRSGVAESRATSIYAQSGIQEYVPGAGPVLATANAAATLLFLIVPLPLLLEPSAAYIAFSAAIVTFWLVLGKIVWSSSSSGRLRSTPHLARPLALVIAVVTVQAVFEPDYGSYFKHLTPVLPLFLAAVVREARHRAPQHRGFQHNGLKSPSASHIP